MTAPTSPYGCESSHVAAFATIILRKQTDFHADTPSTKTAVDAMIGMIASQVDMALQSAGYIMPIAEIEGETWPDHQTSWLRMIIAMGTAAFAVGHVLKPAPALSPSRPGSTGNLFQDLFNFEIKKIWNPATQEASSRLRAQTYPMSPAQLAITNPVAPMTDWSEGKFDYARHADFYDVADTMHRINVQLSSRYNTFRWDHLYDLFDINKGFRDGYLQQNSYTQILT